MYNLNGPVKRVVKYIYVVKNHDNMHNINNSHTDIVVKLKQELWDQLFFFLDFFRLFHRTVLFLISFI